MKEITTMENRNTGNNLHIAITSYEPENDKERLAIYQKDLAYLENVVLPNAEMEMKKGLDKNLYKNKKHYNQAKIWYEEQKQHMRFIKNNIEYLTKKLAK